ncbi:MAG: hypothetical protein PHX80_04230 [Candidatus Nanoarchaeia archaeon]|nr:hypothetical protein [Candidatus Nanoarchaeia archaeon]
MSTRNQSVKPTKVMIGDEEVELDYTVDSFFYLEDKDIPFAKIFKPTDYSMESVFAKQNLSNILEAIYAGLRKLDDNEEDKSGWSVKRLQKSIRISQIPSISKAIMEAITVANPVVEPDPTKASEKGAKDGTGITL